MKDIIDVVVNEEDRNKHLKFRKRLESKGDVNVKLGNY